MLALVGMLLVPTQPAPLIHTETFGRRRLKKLFISYFMSPPPSHHYSQTVPTSSLRPPLFYNTVLGRRVPRGRGEVPRPTAVRGGRADIFHSTARRPRGCPADVVFGSADRGCRGRDRDREAGVRRGRQVRAAGDPEADGPRPGDLLQRCRGDAASAQRGRPGCVREQVLQQGFLQPDTPLLR